MTPYVFEGHFTRQDKATSEYHYLPFDVPEGITHINVRYDFTRTSHASRKAGYENIVDIGLFDPRGHEPHGDGFRGWRGSDQAEFTVGLAGATPGYLPGPIPAGTWHIILGLYKIAPEGCDYTVTVTLTQGSQPASYPTPAPQSIGIARTGAGWYRGDLHAHTHHSDAGASVAEIADVARARGLDFLAITDHNTVSHFPELAVHSSPDLLLIPGLEVTTYYGHANLWGLSRWVDFRCRDAGVMRRIMEAAHKQGALFSINHPYSVIGGIWEYGWLEGTDVMEVWNAVWMYSNYEALNWYDELLQEGRRIVAVGGSDRHQSRDFDPHYPLQVGAPTTWIYASNLSVDDILAGVRAGHVFVTADVDGPQIHLTAGASNGQRAMMGDVLELPVGTPIAVDCLVLGGRGKVLEFIRDGQVMDRRSLGDDDARMTWTVPARRDGYVRAQVVARPLLQELPEPAYPLMLALTNPIYVRVR